MPLNTNNTCNYIDVYSNNNYIATTPRLYYMLLTETFGIKKPCGYM